MTDEPSPWVKPVVTRRRAFYKGWLSPESPAVQSALRLAIVALTASWLGFYFITRLPYLELDAFRATVTLHAITGVVVLPYLLSLVAYRRLPGGSVLDVPVALLLTVYLWTTASSLDWRVSLEVMLTGLMAVGVFYVLSDGRLLRRSQVEWALMAAVLAAATKAIWVSGGDYLDWLRLTDAVHGGLSFGSLIPPTVPEVHDVGDHPNLLSGILAMSLPFFLIAFMRLDMRVLRAAVIVAAGVVLLAMFLTLGRSGWLGGGVGVAVTAAVLVLVTPRGLAFMRRLRPETDRDRIMIGLVGFGLALLVVAATLTAQAVEARPLWLFRESGTPRIDVMEAGLDMFADYPLLGTGPGVFSLLYPEYSGLYPNHAFHTHNGYLQAAVDMGLPGIFAMLLLAGALGWLLVQGLRRTEGDARLSIAACTGSFAAFAAFSLLEAPNGFKGPLVALAAVGAVAVLSHREREGEFEFPFWLPADWLSTGRAFQITARLLIPVALVGLLVTWGRLDLGNFYYSDALSLANRQRWPEAVEQAQRAVDLDPQFAIYRFQLGAIQGQAYFDTRSPALLGGAVAQLERGLELEPRSAVGHANLALLLADAGDRERARLAALAAIEFANSDPAVVLAAGSALEQSDWPDEAVVAYARALTLDAGLADSQFWAESAFRVASFPAILDRSIAFSPCTLLLLTLRGAPPGAIDGEQAFFNCGLRVIAFGAVADRVALAEAMIRRGMFDNARAHIDYVLSRQPDHGAGRTALGRWYAALGNLEEAREQWLRAGQLGEVDALVLLGNSYPVGEVPQAVIDALRSELREAASQVQFHLTGILYYRFKFFRESPVEILLPGEWREAVPGRYDRARDALDRWNGVDPTQFGAP